LINIPIIFILSSSSPPCQALVRIERTATDAALIQKIYFF